MKIVLVQNATYVPVYGGAQKSNRRLVEGLAARGHTCCVVARAYVDRDPGAHSRFLDTLAGEGAEVRASSPQSVVFCRQGVQVHAVARRSLLDACLVERIREIEPTWVLVSSSGVTHSLLQAALDACPTRVIYVARGTLELPFGPLAFSASRATTELLGQMAAIVTTTNFLKRYVREWGGLDATVLPLSLFGPGPFPRFGCFDAGAVTMVNPCAYKGIAILLALARLLPDVPFAAVPTWGTTEEDRAALERPGNIRVLEPVDDIDEIFGQTQALLVPSLWGEGFGRIVIEAMLRGIPVLASDVGGLAEAKLGVDYLLPVRPIERYREDLDSLALPVPVVPEQDVGPWVEALCELLSDRACYDRLSWESREAALAFVANLGGVERLEAFLDTLAPPAKPGHDGHTRPANGDQAGDDVSRRVGTLSPQRRALLARLARERQADEPEREEVARG